jgi:alpha-galactosidase
MSILFHAERRLFHLQGTNMSYVMQVGSDNLLHHLYWGARLNRIPDFLYDRAPYRRAALVEGQPAVSPRCSREFFHYECPTYGSSDFRLPSISAAELQTGSAILDLQFVSYRIAKGREPIPGLPYAHGTEDEAETLTILLKDPVNGLHAELHYHLFADVDVLTRHMTVLNLGDEAFHLEQAMSATLDMEDGSFCLLTLDGTTLREFTPCVQPLRPGIMEVSSTRGISSHQHSPNIALLRGGADQYQGEVAGVSLLYSGNFTLRAEMDQYGALRVQAGINPFRFCWLLKKGERFDTPEVVLAWSDRGLNGLSACMHPFIFRHILRGNWQYKTRPLLLNTWEACYFDVNEEKLYTLGDACAKRGVELLALDDGWFGHRNAANSSLGDWWCNKEKFPHGLDAAADRLNGMGLKMGLWVEPEMVSPDSELYRSHPDWCLHVNGRVRTEWRNQLVLDLSRADVTDYIMESLDRLLQSGKITYLKWDLNRRLTEAFSELLPPDRQAEVCHRYMLGLYKILAHVTEKYPEVLLENCASGGGRFDMGMLCYFHQGWLSDNTDAVSRLAMQDAASIFFPPAVITGHVAVCPNHQIGRTTPLHFRTDVCALFNAGYELDPTKLSAGELEQMSETSEQIIAVRETVQHGRFFRLNRDLIPREWFGWMALDDKRAVIGYYRPWCRPEAAYWTIPLMGLDENALYTDTRTKETLSGAEWHHIGIRPDWKEGDFFSQIIILEKMKPV